MEWSYYKTFQRTQKVTHLLCRFAIMPQKPRNFPVWWTGRWVLAWIIFVKNF